MHTNVIGIIALIVILSTTATSLSSGEPLRLDATSDATAEQSFGKMLGQVDGEQQDKLIFAMIKLNMAGVQSAHEVLANPDLQSPSIARIKDQVAGMTADEIIALADRTSEVTIEIHRE